MGNIPLNHYKQVIIDYDHAITQYKSLNKIVASLDDEIKSNELYTPKAKLLKKQLDVLNEQNTHLDTIISCYKQAYNYLNIREEQGNPMSVFRKAVALLEEQVLRERLTADTKEIKSFADSMFSNRH